MKKNNPKIERKSGWLILVLGGVLTSILVISCSKEEIMPEDDLTSQSAPVESFDKKILPMLYLTKNQEIVRKISNKEDHIIGKLIIKSDGKIIHFDFEPVHQRKFMAAYLHMDTKANFPIWRKTGLPRLESFAYKYEFIHRTNGDLKDKNASVSIYNSISSGRALFSVPVKDVPDLGIMALQVRCSKDENSDRMDEMGFGWLHGVLFSKDDESMYIYYSTKMPRNEDE